MQCSAAELLASATADGSHLEDTTYDGGSQVTLYELDLNGNIIGQQTYTIATFATVDDPKSYAGVTETNAFNFVANAGAANNGDYIVFSAAVMTAPSGNFLNQFWSYQQTEPGLYSGVLNDDTFEVNYIMAPYQVYPGAPPIAWPNTMRQGSEIAIRFTDSSTLDYAIIGFTKNLSYYFEIVASTVTDTPGLTGVQRVAPAAGQTITSSSDYAPQFVWSHQEGIEYYHIYVADSSYSTAHVNQWYAASQVCSNLLCALPVSLWLNNGSYNWWIGYWFNGIGDYSQSYSNSTFSIALPAPGPTTRLTNGDVQGSSVTIGWQQQPGALWYHVWLGTADYSVTNVMDWYSISDLCDGSICAGVVNNLPPGSYEWWIEAWGPSGYSTWTASGPANFVIP